MLLKLVSKWSLLGYLCVCVASIGETLETHDAFSHDGNTHGSLNKTPNYTHGYNNAVYNEDNKEYHNLNFMEDRPNYTHIQSASVNSDNSNKEHRRCDEHDEEVLSKSSKAKFGHRRPGLPKVLILHPIYAGSHELTLRNLGESLVERGWSVTQVRWRSTKTREVNSKVEVITLSPDNRDRRYPYMSEDGIFQPPTSMLWERPRQLWQ
ncbi:unnamed protein product, partial [Meganyctiphanes norvegica]